MNPKNILIGGLIAFSAFSISNCSKKNQPEEIQEIMKAPYAKEEFKITQIKSFNFNYKNNLNETKLYTGKLLHVQNVVKNLEYELVYPYPDSLKLGYIDAKYYLVKDGIHKKVILDNFVPDRKTDCKKPACTCDFADAFINADGLITEMNYK